MRGTSLYIMKTAESEMDYNIRILQSMIHDQATRYFMFTKTFRDESDAKLAAELANKCAYNINIAGSIHKTFKQEKRLKRLEEKMEGMPINMSIFEEAPLQEYR